MRSRSDFSKPMAFARDVPQDVASAVELGAHSVKCHSFGPDGIRTVKFPYELGHEVYTVRRISEPTIRRVVELVRQNTEQPAFAIGTSAVRDAANRWMLLEQLRFKLRMPVHLLTSWEEACLLARGFLEASGMPPALVLDIGGGSVELVYLNAQEEILWDSLPLGVIRLHHHARLKGEARAAHRIEEHLANVSIPAVDCVYAAGGTVKAISRVLGKKTFGLRDVVALEARARSKGSPPGLKPARARVFLPGLVLVRELIAAAEARTLTRVDISVGRRALEECLAAQV